MTLPIILIGWLYVTILMAATEPNIVAGILTFTLYGGIPCALILYFASSKVRRERARYREMQEMRQAGQPGQPPENETPAGAPEAERPPGN